MGSDPARRYYRPFFANNSEQDIVDSIFENISSAYR